MSYSLVSERHHSILDQEQLIMNKTAKKKKYDIKSVYADEQDL